ncbi:MAG: hypothetical protein ACYTKD_06350 [Planctomycetota bacterium]
MAGRFVSALAAFLVAALLAGCGLDGGGGGGPTALSGDAVQREEGTAPEPVVPPPADPPPTDPGPADPEPTDPPRGEPYVDPESEADDPGPQFGELKQLRVDIAFSGASGSTVTDENGITYTVGSWVSSEDKVYPSEYWGTYPLYFFGNEVGVTVTVTNLGPRQTFRLVVRTEAYCLQTDGSNGATLLAPTDVEIEVSRDQTVQVDASFTASYVPGAESGLDRFIVKVLHPNVVDSPGDEPALILQKEAVFCPPEHEPPTEGDAF